MRLGHVLLVSLLAMAAAGLSVVAHRYDQLWIAVAAMSGVFVGGGLLLHLRGGALMRELEILREHLEGTRQHAALLARHTRELREAFVYTTSGGAVRPDEFATLSALVRDLADGVSELDRRIEATEIELGSMRRDKAGMAGHASRPSAPPSAPSWVSGTRNPPPQSPASRPAAEDRGLMREVASTPATSRAPERAHVEEPPRAVRQLIAAAIAADRFDLFLQRVVNLPQRKIRAYDVTLRPDGSDLSIPNSEIRAAVDAVGHQLSFDRKLMIQAVRLARVFEQRDRDVVLFVDISQRFLMSEAAFDDLEALIADVPQAASRIVLSLPQRFFKKAVAFEHEALRTLGKMGFTFMMRDVDDFDFDPHKIAQMGVRWLRMGTDQFLVATQDNEMLLDVASADVVALLARRRLAFVADGVADENQVAELIDFGVEFAQGPVFALPQAVRADVLETPPQPTESPRTGESALERRGLRDLARRA